MCTFHTRPKCCFHALQEAHFIALLIFLIVLQVLWAALVVCSLATPLPDEYKIPKVGNNQRSQYYVLHDDGSFKYGYDTGEDAFESQKTNVDGDVDGKFGYKDEDGQEFNIQYTSGISGFRPEGEHIPKVHPAVEAAFASARAREPFIDPLADDDTDKSFDFKFDGEEYSRNEVSNPDGTVTGTFSYIDEHGRTRNYRYRAGAGIGFEIEGDDIPQPVQPLPSHQQTVPIQHSRTTKFRGANKVTQHSTNHVSNVNRQTQRAQTRTNTGSRKVTVPKPSQTYFAPSSSHVPSVTHQAQVPRAQTPFVPKTRTNANIGATTRQFEPSNVRTSFSPSGKYSVEYETSSHSRSESGDDDNNVNGRFTFRADDDGEERTVTYSSGVAGFRAQGDHFPVGPLVPGTLTGRADGNYFKVEETPFIDPLADDDLDASYNFAFNSDTHSRTETADEDGNVVGQYSVLGEDNILRTYRYRAGEGIGFETEEISAIPAGGQRRTQQIHQSTSNQQRTTFSHGSNHGSQHSAARQTHRTKVGSTRQHTAHTPGVPQVTLHSSRATAQSAYSAGSHGTSTASTGSSSTYKSGTRSQTRTSKVFPGFTLRKYDPSEGRGKYGYVLKFDD